MQCGNVVIPKSVTEKRIIENGDIFDFNISDTDMAVLVSEGLHIVANSDTYVYSRIQSNLGYPNSFVLRILYCVRISEFVQITEVVAKISRKRLVQQFNTFQLLLSSS